MIATIILGVSLIAVATGNLIITNLNIKEHKRLEKRIDAVQWYAEEIKIQVKKTLEKSEENK